MRYFLFSMMLALIAAVVTVPAVAQEETSAPEDAVAVEDGAKPEENVAEESAVEEPVAEEVEDPGWEMSWRDYIGEIKIFTEAELPEKMKEANRRDDKADPEIMFTLGYMYQYGEGIQPDDALAQKWYNKAAKKNNPRAMLALGELYYSYGDGNLAAKWFKKASEAKQAYAHYKMGEIYEYGFGGLPAKPETAFEFYTRAAEGGIDNANLKLGQFYQYGFGTSLNVTKAIEFYKKLLNTENKTRKTQVEYMLSEVYAMIAEQKTGQEAIDSWRQSAELGNLRSIVRLADLYNTGDTETPQNIPEAMKWYEKAVAMGDVYSMIKLGYIYNNGTLDMDPDYCRAFEYFNKAAEKKSKEAMFNLGHFYANGYCKDVPVNYEKANEWWRRSQ